ncbi:MAG: 1-deoxy-D-xylulose-5-phosphate reductoisomerase [Chloroflexota bacterium]|nr:1-deoxy-D-xylulose-5-phosphate reductoisomerase [Chloroflexota bacterium]
MKPPSFERVGVAILGSTGSIGRQTLSVIDRHPDRFKVVALAGGHNTGLLSRQVSRFGPTLVSSSVQFDSVLPDGVRALNGPEGLVAVATHPDADIVVVATGGHDALSPTIQAISAGKTIALANKEVIVCAGALIMSLAAKAGVKIRPVDSEHSAIWQCMSAASAGQIQRLILTASGGPFLTTPESELGKMTAHEALAHPTWSMGAKVTIDSATMMNKGLELIEAHWLFDVPFSRIDVLIHPESIIHSLIELTDGAQIAQLASPDMRQPIQFALTYPERLDSGVPTLSLSDIGCLRFALPDFILFPALGIARQAGEAGGTMPTVLSAVDDVAVAAFLAGRITFGDIPAVLGAILGRHDNQPVDTIEIVQQTDIWARREAELLIEKKSGTTFSLT